MKKVLKLVGIALVVIIVISMAFGGKKDTNSKVQNAFKAGMEAGQRDPSEEKKYQELARENTGSTQNISVLVSTDESNAQAIAEEVKKTCDKQCNINIYDDKKAFELQEQYDTVMGNSSAIPSDLETWKKANYVYVADHLVGYIDFSSGTYTSYPFKDNLYKELTTQK